MALLRVHTRLCSGITPNETQQLCVVLGMGPGTVECPSPCILSRPQNSGFLTAHSMGGAGVQEAMLPLAKGKWGGQEAPNTPVFSWFAWEWST